MTSISVCVPNNHYCKPAPQVDPRAWIKNSSPFRFVPVQRSCGGDYAHFAQAQTIPQNTDDHGLRAQLNPRSQHQYRNELPEDEVQIPELSGVVIKAPS
jgi:hypothetical protein